MIKKIFYNKYVNILVSNYSILLIGLLSSIIINRSLSLNDRGELAYILNAAGIAVLIFSLGLSNALNYSSIRLSEKYKKMVLFFSLKKILLFSFLFIPLFITANNIGNFIKPDLLYLAIVLIYLQVLLDMQKGYLLAKSAIFRYSFINICFRFLFTFLIILLYWLEWVDLHTILYSQIIALLLVLVYFYKESLLKKHEYTYELKKKLKSKIYKIAFNNVITNSATIIRTRIDVFFVGSILGNSFLGTYAVALFIVGLFNLVHSSVGVLIANKVAKEKKNNLSYTFKVAVILSFIMTALLVLFYYFGEYFIVLLYTEKYLESYWIILFFAPVIVLDAFIGSFANALAGKGYPKEYAIVEWISLGLFLVLMYLFTSLGIFGIVFSFIITKVLSGIYIIYISTKYLKAK